MQLSDFTIGDSVIVKKQLRNRVKQTTARVNCIHATGLYLNLPNGFACKAHQGKFYCREFVINGVATVVSGCKATDLPLEMANLAIDFNAPVIAPITSDEDCFKQFTTGIEIEMFSPRSIDITNTLIDKFDGLRVGCDGSINGYPTGNSAIEIQTHIIPSDKVKSDVTEICKVISEHEGDVNTSCGLHVHLGSKNLTNEQVLNVAKVFKEAEPVIFAMLPQSRRGNRYCKALTANRIASSLDKLTMAEELVYQQRLKSSRGIKVKINKMLKSFNLDPKDSNAHVKFAKNYSLLTKLIKNRLPSLYWMSVDKSDILERKYINAKRFFIAQESKRNVPVKEFKIADLMQRQLESDNKSTLDNFAYLKRNGKNGKDRYFGLNLTSHFYRGTIEFRYHAGTVNAEKMLNWIKFLHYVTDYAINRFDKGQLAELKATASVNDKLDVLAQVTGLPTKLKSYCQERIQTFA